ncbi:MAG: FliM/FliN family flagellar motor switch protein [Opitutaceae bacterium]|nr:FliM/FliN family flagellar motor switch protein [Opitutaceae bacterium]
MAEETTQPASETFDQKEVEQMITPPPVETPQGGVVPATPAAQRVVKPIDFRNPVFLSEGELRRLRLSHDDFVRYLSARLSLFLRMEVSLKVASLLTTTYGKFTDGLPSPTHLSLFKIEPLVGAGILELGPRLALSFTDRLLGGRGVEIKGERALTEIETALVEDVLLIILDEWCGQWKYEQPLKPAIIGTESSGRFLQTSPRDAIVLELTLECVFGDCTEQIRIGLPYYTAEPLVKKLFARRQKEATVAPAPRRAEWQPAYDRIKVPVRAEWDALVLSLREISCLRVGDVVEMPPTLCAETRVLMNGAPKFVGTVGLDTDRVAVQLTRKLHPEETSHAQPDGRKIT